MLGAVSDASSLLRQNAARLNSDGLLVIYVGIQTRSADDDDRISHDRFALSLKDDYSFNYSTTLTSAGGGGNSLNPPESF